MKWCFQCYKVTFSRRTYVLSPALYSTDNQLILLLNKIGDLSLLSVPLKKMLVLYQTPFSNKYLDQLKIILKPFNATCTYK
jgi:hypothetical protein